MAAGLSLKPEKMVEFRTRLNELARCALRPEQLQPTLRLDAEVQPGDLTFDRVRELGRLQQTGIGNPPVQLFVCNLTHQRPPQRMGPDKKHARLWVTDGTVTHEAVMWSVGNAALPAGRFDLAFAPQLGEYKGNWSLQLKVLDWRAVE